MSVLLLWTAVAVRGQHFDYDAIAPHPRLLLPSVDEVAVKAAAEQVPALAWIQSRLFAFCDATLSEPPVERIKTGRRLLDVSRLALKRIYYLAYAYRMSGDERYYARAVREMEAVCTFEDWNPIHFLDVGEMVLGLAIGYDWLYDRLPGEMRARICRAIVEKGFAPTAIPKYGDKCYKRTNNWNQVCNAGLVYGALAIYEEFPEQCREIVEKCMESNPRAMTVYAPDGGYPEGYNYWGYGTGFEVMLIAALESALGHDGGLSASEGFLGIGPVHAVHDRSVRLFVQLLRCAAAGLRASHVSLVRPADRRLFAVVELPARRRRPPNGLHGPPLTAYAAALRCRGGLAVRA